LWHRRERNKEKEKKSGKEWNLLQYFHASSFFKINRTLASVNIFEFDGQKDWIGWILESSKRRRGVGVL
jgi:hypothetical protein